MKSAVNYSCKLVVKRWGRSRYAVRPRNPDIAARMSLPPRRIPSPLYFLLAPQPHHSRPPPLQPEKSLIHLTHRVGMPRNPSAKPPGVSARGKSPEQSRPSIRNRTKPLGDLARRFRGVQKPGAVLPVVLFSLQGPQRFRSAFFSRAKALSGFAEAHVFVTWP